MCAGRPGPHVLLLVDGADFMDEASGFRGPTVALGAAPGLDGADLLLQRGDGADELAAASTTTVLRAPVTTAHSAPLLSPLLLASAGWLGGSPRVTASTRAITPARRRPQSDHHYASPRRRHLHAARPVTHGHAIAATRRHSRSSASRTPPVAVARVRRIRTTEPPGRTSCGPRGPRARVPRRRVRCQRATDAALRFLIAKASHRLQPIIT